MNRIQNLLMIVFLFPAGCALSPQEIDLYPEINIKQNAQHTGTTSLTVDIVDKRTTRIIGQRGGVYKETSDISTASNATAQLQQILAGAFMSAGYIVKPLNERTDADLTLEISDLSYRVFEEKVTKLIETKAEIRVIVRKGTKDYTAIYRVTRTKEVLTLPDENENEELVNTALTAAFDKMFDDGELLAFIDS